MKTSLKSFFFLSVPIAGLGLMMAGQVTAQTFKILHSFTATSGFSGTRGPNSDGAVPLGRLILSGSVVYGTANAGGSSGYGTVFKVKTNGTDFTTLYAFAGDDGANPEAGLTIGGNTLYGTTFDAGLGQGTVFALTTNLTDGAILHVFAGYTGYPSEGANPGPGSLVLSGNTLYGTTGNGGSYNQGTVFKVSIDGSGFATLHNFTAGNINSSGVPTNSDGIHPAAGVILSGNTLYGTAVLGGSSGSGSVFKVKTDGSGFATLHSFTAVNTNSSGVYTNSDGAEPLASLILSGNTLYGEAASCGIWGNGTVFAVNTNGTGFTTLHSFTAVNTNSSGVPTNSDGASPGGGLILSGNTLYGTASAGGSSSSGTLFAVKTNGTGFTTLYGFTGMLRNPNSIYLTNSDGALANAGLMLSGNTLYGTASAGGSSGSGTLFSLALPGPPRLKITPSGANMVLTWPTNAAGFSLQFTTNLISPAVWSTNVFPPVVADGQNTVTNASSGTRRFYRLSQ